MLVIKEKHYLFEFWAFSILLDMQFVYHYISFLIVYPPPWLWVNLHLIFEESFMTYVLGLDLHIIAVYFDHFKNKDLHLSLYELNDSFNLRVVFFHLGM